jgi:hypothetical protein
MDLKNSRIKFTKLFCQLIQWGNSQSGYELAIGRDFDEGHEPLHHMSGSLHYMGLANDLALYVDGVYQTDTEAYRRLGKAWLALDPDCRWGGNFKQFDGNHFSITYGGKA